MWTEAHRARHDARLKEIVPLNAVAQVARWLERVDPPRSGRAVDSSGRRNTAYVSCSEELVQSLGRCPPAQGLSRPAVEGDRHSGEVLGAVHAEVGAFWKVLPQQPVGVLVRATLPGAVGIAEVDRHASLDPELGVLGHFRSLIPGQRSSQLFG